MTADQSRPVPRASEAQGIDRDALRAVLRDIDTDAYFDQRKPLDEQVDRILALVRPVEGVTLTREQAHNAATCVRMVRQGAVSDPYSAAELEDLAARLEASS